MQLFNEASKQASNQVIRARKSLKISRAFQARKPTQQAEPFKQASESFHASKFLESRQPARLLESKLSSNPYEQSKKPKQRSLEVTIESGAETIH